MFLIDGMIYSSSRRESSIVNKKTQFKINKKIMTEVIDIAESVGKVSISSQISVNPTLRRTNRI